MGLPVQIFQRIATGVCFAALGLGLAGCGGGGMSSGANADMRGALAAQPATQTIPLAVAPAIGVPPTRVKMVSDALSGALAAKGIPVVAMNGTQQFTVRSYLAAGAAPTGTKLSYIWDVTDKTNKRLKRIQGEEVLPGAKAGDPWALLDDAAMQRLASKAAEEIAAWLPTQQQPANVAGATTPSSGVAARGPGAATTQPAPAAPAMAATPPLPADMRRAAATAPSAAPIVTGSTGAADPAAAQAPPASAARGPLIAAVPTVVGAPGDGATSLTAAMRRQLASQGVQVAEGVSAVYTVRGAVELGAAEDGKQPIIIRWTVVDKAGKPLEKTVVQRNKVDEGALDGPWGKVADMAAGEAAKSVARIITGGGAG